MKTEISGAIQAIIDRVSSVTDVGPLEIGTTGPSDYDTFVRRFPKCHCEMQIVQKCLQEAPAGTYHGCKVVEQQGDIFTITYETFEPNKTGTAAKQK